MATATLSNGRSKTKKKEEVPKKLSRPQLFALCKELVTAQHKRAVFIKSRNMQANRLQAIVAGTLGYSSDMTDAQRKEKFVEATKHIDKVMKGQTDGGDYGEIISITQVGIKAFEASMASLEKDMEEMAGKLPVAEWVNHIDQRGFGMLLLAVVVGEAGDLFNYANPAKLWRRFGCAPWECDGKTLMGASWRSGKYGKLPQDEWTKFGYSPRRRSIAYLIGDCIVKLNREGPYRKRYDEVKAAIKKLHKDYPDGRCHRHGMLLATKLLLKNLWLEWHDHPPQKVWK